MPLPQKDFIIEPFCMKGLLYVAIKKVCNLIDMKNSKNSSSLSLKLQNLHENPYNEILTSCKFAT
jgi:hypothetical protein